MDYVETLKKQKYKVFGENQHSAAKLCGWLKHSLRCEGTCYKQKFYGIQSHKCVQMSPSIYCNQRCIFCWRSWESCPLKFGNIKWDEPKEIVEQSILAQRKMLEGYYGSLEIVDKKLLDEAQNPTQFAISLVGEPTLYPYLDELINLYNKKGTSFLVSNATRPEILQKVKPTQMYISLDAPNLEIHKKVNIPIEENTWDKINQTLEIYPEIKTRKTIRFTMIKGMNDTKPEEYANLIKKSQTDFVEFKAYMFIGGSRQRLTIENMPRHEEVKAFAEQINKHLGYEYVDEQPESRVVLYSSGKKKPII